MVAQAVSPAGAVISAFFSSLLNERVTRRD